MEFLPSANRFKINFLLFTIGKCKERTLSAEFESLVERLSSDQESHIIEILYNQTFTPRRLSVQYFANKKSWISFIIGMVHYCPGVLLHQLNSTYHVRRLNAVKLMERLIEELLKESENAIDRVFEISTVHTAASSKLVFLNFVLSSRDREPSIRRAFLNTAHGLLKSSSDPLDNNNLMQVQKAVLDIINTNRSDKLCLYGLKIIKDIYTGRHQQFLFHPDISERFVTMIITDFKLDIKRQILWTIFEIFLKFLRRYLPNEHYNLKEPKHIFAALVHRHKANINNIEKRILNAQIFILRKKLYDTSA